jgi:hypothetical protein
MFSCKVGKEFKIGFFKRNLNFCFDEESGTIYCNDLNTIEKLGIDKATAEVVSSIKKEEKITYLSETQIRLICKVIAQEEVKKIQDKIQETNKSNVLEDSSKSQIEILEKKVNLIERTLNEIVKFQEENQALFEDKDAQADNDFKVLKNSVGLLNKKIKDANESIESLMFKFEAIIELLSDQAARNNDQFPNVLKNGITVEKIWNSTKDKHTAALLSIMVMMKRELEEKGLRF